MFFLAVMAAVVIGYAVKGRLRNIDVSEVKCLSLVFAAFLLEFIVLFLIKKGMLSIGIITYVSDVIMYGMLAVFTYVNRRNKWLLLLGTGAMLNAVVIFANGGVMPVNGEVVKSFGYHGNVASQGLYKLVDKNTRLYFLADIVPIRYPFKLMNPGLASAGDLVEITGMAIFIITEMKKKSIKNNLDV